ncbi:MAG: hypothetical protein AB7E52_07365, partial [Bdellovibrionales bacterium]
MTKNVNIRRLWIPTALLITSAAGVALSSGYRVASPEDKAEMVDDIKSAMSQAQRESNINVGRVRRKAFLFQYCDPCSNKKTYELERAR